MSSEADLRRLIRMLISEDADSNVLTLRTPGSSHYGWSASHPKKKKARRPSLGYQEDEGEVESSTEPVEVSRAFGTSY